MKKKMKIVAFCLAAVVAVSCVSLCSPAVYAVDSGLLKATDATVTLDGTNPASVTVTLVGTESQNIYAIEGNWDTTDQKKTGYITLSSIESDILTFSAFNYVDIPSGKVLWTDDTFDHPGVLTNKSEFLRATYKVDSNTPSGKYYVGFHCAVIAGSDYDADETGYFYRATITVVNERASHTDKPVAPDIPDTPVPSVPVWTNCSKAWAETYLWTALEMGIYPDILLQTDMTLAITREEFAAVAVKYYEALTGKEAKLNTTVANPFTDVTAQQEDILIAYQLGFVKGTSTTTFAPNGTLTRSQAVTMLGRVVELVETGSITNGSSLKLGSVLKIFSDSHLVADWAANYVNYFVSHGVIDGTGDGTFAPNGNMTREQAMKVAVVALDK